MLDILSFVFAIIIGEHTAYNIMKKNVNILGNRCVRSILVLMIFVILAFFIIFTYKTPQINYFKDPITNTYGINKS